jgi:hypothetical protein
VDNKISTVLSGGPFLGVGFGIDSGADGSNYLARENTIDDVNIGIEVKEASTELRFIDNDLKNIDSSQSSGTELYFGELDSTEDSPLASIIAGNAFDQSVAPGGQFSPYDQTIQPGP